MKKIAIQGENGSNSHMAAAEMFAGSNPAAEVVPCDVSGEVIRKVVAREVDGALLPIENSLHGSVAEHFDLLLAQPVRVVRESSMRIRHHVLAGRGVRLEDVRTVRSHPVALSQCRRWLTEHPGIVAVPFYDTAGSVKHILKEGFRDAAAIAPALSAGVYGADVLVEGVEDHAENYTRFLLIVGEGADGREVSGDVGPANKISVAFTVEHRPGTLVRALEGLARIGADLTKIESRPVSGHPWEYVFYVDLRFEQEAIADAALDLLRIGCRSVKELGRYRAAAALV